MTRKIYYAGCGFSGEDITDMELLNFALSHNQEEAGLLCRDCLGKNFSGKVGDISDEEKENIAAEVGGWAEDIGGSREKYIAEVINMSEGSAIVKGGHGFVYFEKFMLPCGKNQRRVCTAEELQGVVKKYFPDSHMKFGLICRKKDTESPYHIANFA